MMMHFTLNHCPLMSLISFSWRDETGDGGISDKGSDLYSYIVNIGPSAVYNDFNITFYVKS